MSLINRSLFLNTGIANPAHYVARGVPIQISGTHSKSKPRAAPQNRVDDRAAGFQLAGDAESSEQYLWSAAWFVMFLLFLCTT